MPLLLLLCACAAWFPRYPGPLAPIGRLPPENLPELGPEAPDERHPDERRPDALVDSVVASADYYLHHRLSSGHPDDCSGFVCAVYERAGVPLDLDVVGLWERAEQAHAVHHHKIPEVGDLAFFDGTYDKDRDGKQDDPLTHVAVVLSVDADGTIHLAQGGSSHGRTTLTMNLKQPSVHYDDDGKLLNSYLRYQRSSDPAGMHYLAGELWRGFATVDAKAVDAWLTSPGS